MQGARIGDQLWLALARIVTGYARSLVLLPMIIVFFAHGFFILSLINPSLAIYDELHDNLRYVVPWLPRRGDFDLDASGIVRVYLWLSLLLSLALAAFRALLRRRFEIPSESKFIVLAALLVVSSLIFATTATIPTLPERFLAFGIVLLGSLGFTVFPLWLFSVIDEFLAFWERS
ncbi:hypothetical protein HY375_00020 [Candidatus Berkelbacteria bacterium]|nr:hypothetical protein [Candidatus Berkelbacteria bacterium]